MNVLYLWTIVIPILTARTRMGRSCALARVDILSRDGFICQGKSIAIRL